MSDSVCVVFDKIRQSKARQMHLYGAPSKNKVIHSALHRQEDSHLKNKKGIIER